jgi:MYXO-CTERM domain-containing protein
MVANVPPIPEAVAPQEAPLALELRLELMAADPGGAADPLRWTLVSGPGAVTPEGVFTWTPDAEGVQVVTARVEDDDGGATDLHFEINAVRLELTGNGCGCGSAGAGAPLALGAALLAWWTGRRRRREG